MKNDVGLKILGIDIGSSKVCAVIAQKDEDDIKILGSGVAEAQGLKKGTITNIEQASRSIKIALKNAKQVAGTNYDKVYVSISGAYTKSLHSNGVINIQSQEIGIAEITRVMELADNNANMPSESEKIHILPYNFKVDDQEAIDDPLGMNGSRLEVQVHIIVAQKSTLSNLKKAIKLAGVGIDGIVYSGYASSIAVLNEDEKQLGVCMIDMGASTCDMIVRVGNSIRCNRFLGVGSFNVTNDLSVALHTPLGSAESVKIKHGSLLGNQNNIVEIPKIGEEGEKSQVSLGIVLNIIQMRLEETLMLLDKSLEESGFHKKVGAGIVLTGGFTKIEGIRDLATVIFKNLPIRIARPKPLGGMFEDLDDSMYATVLGLIMYGCGHFTPYEIDSNKSLRYKDEVIKRENKNFKTEFNKDAFKLSDNSNKDDIIQSKNDDNTLKSIADLEKKNQGMFGKIFDSLKNAF